MPIQLPYILSQVDLSNLPDAIDSSGDIIGKALGAQILDENFLRLAKVVNVSETAPVEVYDGMLWLDTTENVIKMWNGGQWISRTDLTNQIKVSATAPPNPASGTIWLDTGYKNTLKIWDGEVWRSRIDITNRVVASIDAPTNPKLGGTWFDTSLKQLKIWDGETWVSISGDISSITGDVPNGSFELDSNNDGIPDGWTRVLYDGGSAEYETNNPAHGSKAYKFTRPAGINKGGGYLESDYIGMDEVSTYVITFIMWSTVAGIKNMVQVSCFTKDKELDDTITLFTSTSNPTIPTQYATVFTPTATTRYIKIRLIGGFPDTNVAGTTYFDKIELHPRQYFYTIIFRRDDTERSTNSTSWVDTATQFTLYSVYAGIPIRFMATVSYWGLVSYPPPGEMRWRIGNTYSNIITVEKGETVTGWFTITPNTSGTVTLIMQLKSGYPACTTSGAKNTNEIYFDLP